MGLVTPPLPAGVVLPYAGQNAPAGYLLCDGTSYATSAYAGLFGVIGYLYGGSGANFTVPDLRGRVPFGYDTTQTEFAPQALTGGTKNHQHSSSHTHTLSDAGQAAINLNSTANPIIQRRVTSASWTPTHTIAGGTISTALTSPSQAVAAALTGATDTPNTSVTGAQGTLPPYLVLFYIIKY